MMPKVYEFDKMEFEKMNDKVFRRYVYGEHAMLCYFKLLKGAVIPEHHHPNEQITYIIKGKARVLAGGKEFIVKAGEVIQLPPNVPHRFEALEDTIDLDVFSPPRQDWIEGTATYFNEK